ncbi:hypothetical protein KKC00_02145 [Patescibacteria group bacterium]|nr:hypothetical protein [Patescibacteria group bacterium]
MADDYNPIFTFLAVDIHYLHNIGKKYFYCAKKLFEENNQQKSLHPFCLLATTSAELFLKVIIASNICKEMHGLEKDDANIKTIVSEELKCYGHNIKKLIEKSQIKDEFKISQLEEASNGFVNDYRFMIADKLICFKDSESVRFGSLAKKQDLAQSVQFHFSDQIVDFLDKLSYFSFSKMNEVINTLRSSNENKSA